MRPRSQNNFIRLSEEGYVPPRGARRIAGPEPEEVEVVNYYDWTAGRVYSNTVEVTKPNWFKTHKVQMLYSDKTVESVLGPTGDRMAEDDFMFFRINTQLRFTFCVEKIAETDQCVLYKQTYEPLF